MCHLTDNGATRFKIDEESQGGSRGGLMMDTGECLFCAELIRANARKCWHCGQSLGPPMRESALEDQKNVDAASSARWMIS